MSRSPGLQFRLLGFPVRIEWTFFLVAALVGMRGASLRDILVWMVAVLVSVLLHELGHALVIRRFGIHPEIVLYGMGGQTRYIPWRPLSHWQQIAISAAGPGTGLLVGGAILWSVWHLGAPERPILDSLVFSLIGINIVWSLVNLVPVFPLDGGHIMASIIHLVRGTTRMELPLAISVVCGATAAVVALYFHRIFAAILAGVFTYQSLMQLRASGAGLTRSEVRVIQIVLVLMAGLLLGGYWLLHGGSL
ncbi:MAG: hypothetical protein GXY74_12240 [Phycisphaerae bacterium]|nr:hypothetical protein [Phycisphaerae bacterium]